MSNVVERVKKSAGRNFAGRNRPSNPHITARESIELADYIVGLEEECGRLRRMLNELTHEVGSTF